MKIIRKRIKLSPDQKTLTKESSEKYNNNYLNGNSSGSTYKSSSISKDGSCHSSLTVIQKSSLVMFSQKKDDKEKDDKKSFLKGSKLGTIAGIAALGLGAKTLDNTYKKGEVDGRIKLYHGTSGSAKKAILELGLKAGKSLDPGAITNVAMNGLGKKHGLKMIYLTDDRTTAYGMGYVSRKQFAPIAERKGIDFDSSGGVVKVSIPYEDYKKLSRTYENPEFSGLSKKRWIAHQLDGHTFFLDDKGPYYMLSGEHGYMADFSPKKKRFNTGLERKLAAKQLELYYDTYSGNHGSHTKLVTEDIGPEYIRGSKGYKGQNFKEWSSYVKNNPKRFAKGVGKVALGTAAVLGGGYLIKKGFEKKEKDKDKEEED